MIKHPSISFQDPKSLLILKLANLFVQAVPSVTSRPKCCLKCSMAKYLWSIQQTNVVLLGLGPVLSVSLRKFSQSTMTVDSSDMNNV